MRLEITGKIKPYVRMTQRGKWVKPDAQEYLASKAAIQYKLKNQMAIQRLAPFPPQTPLKISLSFRLPTPHRCDLDNLIKAVLDAAQGVVFKDDRWVDDIVATRCTADEYACVLRVEVLETQP